MYSIYHRHVPFHMDIRVQRFADFIDLVVAPELARPFEEIAFLIDRGELSDLRIKNSRSNAGVAIGKVVSDESWHAQLLEWLLHQGVQITVRVFIAV